MNAYKRDILKPPNLYLKKLGIEDDALNTVGHAEILNLISGNFRTQTLLNIYDLGLHLYGDKSWYESIGCSLDLALCYNEKEISSVAENQILYNQSKIAINTTHAQTKNAFGWRVRDVMATNACLVSDYREDLTTQFGKYVKIPTYETPYEARALCEKLLNDELWRKEIVLGSQLAIEEGHRFRHRFRDLEGIFGIKFFTQKKGQLIRLYSENFLVKQEVKAPEVIVPEVIVPEVIVPEVIVPEVIVPEVIVPKITESKSKVKVPKIRLSEIIILTVIVLAVIIPKKMVVYILQLMMKLKSYRFIYPMYRWFIRMIPQQLKHSMKKMVLMIMAPIRLPANVFQLIEKIKSSRCHNPIYNAVVKVIPQPLIQRIRKMVLDEVKLGEID